MTNRHQYTLKKQRNFYYDSSNLPYRKFKSHSSSQMNTINPLTRFVKTFSKRRVFRVLRFLLFAIMIATSGPLAFAQDGSSELTPEKTVNALGISRLRVRCTDDNLRLYPNATACADEREPESCRMVFTTPASSSPAARDPKCDNPLLKDLAEQCRRTCAICCEDPSYACQNDESGIVNCNQNMEKCGMAEFSQMMIKFCPATCGLCLARKCWDQIEECESMKSLCTNEIYSTFMEHQCARTCGKCKTDDGSDEEHGGDGSNGGAEGRGRRPGNRRPNTGSVSGHYGHKSKIVKSGESDEEEEGFQTNGNFIDNEVNKDRPNGKKGIGKDRSPKRPKEEKYVDDEDEEETCVDVLKNCRKNKKFCRHKSYIEMMRQNCARTCGFCKPKSKHHEKSTSSAVGSNGDGSGSSSSRPASTRAINPECKDNHPFCKNWAANGYCESEEYSDEEKQDKCAKTCGYC